MAAERFTTTIRSLTGRVNAYTTPDLPCIRSEGVINPTVGCAHRCAYCYMGRYTQCQEISVFDTMPELLERQLQRVDRYGNSSPDRIYFSTACDAFQPIKEVQDVTLAAFSALAERGKRVGFLTKGLIREDVMSVIRKNPELFSAQIDINTLDQSVTDVFEPGAAKVRWFCKIFRSLKIAKPGERLAQMKRLADMGVRTSARLDPVLPGVTDTSERLEILFSGISSAGVTSAAVSYLFLRPSIRGSLARLSHPMADAVLAEFGVGKTTEILLHGKSTMTCLLPARRIAGFKIIKDIAAKHGISVSFCACKNSDVAADIEEVGKCNISGPPLPRPAPSSSSAKCRLIAKKAKI